ncbi:hypothetical protein [Pedobacter sp. D749]|uniref:hypothetical protein n=1 Tax=Pedobacter sp. D749 TaxID=2856523 RepID=UPI0010533873|nr:hypothetical protein [Pedobacter sp. D749]QXU39781.1 hypothetical protein KYH19_12155 [Pedobacter sp. D749]
MKCFHPIKIVSFFLLSVLMGCIGKKNEFIFLDRMTFTNSYDKNAVKISYYILINNPEASNEKLKTAIIQYTRGRFRNDQSLKKKDVTSLNFVFYKKTGNTSYFIKNEESPGGLSSEEIAHYKEDYIANYDVTKCTGGFTEKLYLYDLPENTVVRNCK